VFSICRACSSDVGEKITQRLHSEILSRKRQFEENMELHQNHFFDALSAFPHSFPPQPSEEHLDLVPHQQREESVGRPQRQESTI